MSLNLFLNDPDLILQMPLKDLAKEEYVVIIGYFHYISM